jgi:hypothetical protein
MNALYLLIKRPLTSQTSRLGPTPTSSEPLAPIRPGAFARWIAEVDRRPVRDELATNEGIAATRPDAVRDPG